MVTFAPELYAGLRRGHVWRAGVEQLFDICASRMSPSHLKCMHKRRPLVEATARSHFYFFTADIPVSL